MSVQTCGRDQRKMKQVIDQIKVLTNNLEDLRAEIGALSNNYLVNDQGHSSANGRGRGGSNKPNILYKLKKYIRKMRSVDLPKNGPKSAKNQEIYFPRKDLDAPLLSSLRYIFRIGKKGDVLHIPAGITRVKDECSQTDENSNKQFLVPSIAGTLTASKHTNNMENLLQDEAKHGTKQYDKIMYSTKRAIPFLGFSVLNCELDSSVDPIFPSSCAIRTKSDSKSAPQTGEACLSNRNKQLASISTQTNSPKTAQKRKSFNFQSKHSNLYFSKIRNAVITKKIIRNPNEGAFTICGKVNRVKDYPYTKKKLYAECSCKTKRRNNTVETIGRETFEKNFSSRKTSERLNNVSSVSEKNTYENFSSDEELESSSSVSVDLEMNVSHSSSKIEEFPARRKPRTYTINKRSQRYNQNNWFDRYERMVYVGQSSELTLSSHSFPN